MQSTPSMLRRQAQDAAAAAQELPPAAPEASIPPAQRQLAAIVVEHQAMLWRYLRLLGAPASLADDLMQEAFLCAARALERGETIAAPEHYLRGTAKKLFYGDRRRARRAETKCAEAADRLLAADSGALEDDRVDALRRCHEMLCGRAREAVDSHYVEGRSYRDTAAQLGMQPDGLRSLLSRTRDALRACIQRTLRNQNEAP